MIDVREMYPSRALRSRFPVPVPVLAVAALVLLLAPAAWGVPPVAPCDPLDQPMVNLGTAVELGFVENSGQSDAEVVYQGNAPGGAAVFLGADGSASFGLPGGDQPAAAGGVTLVGASSKPAVSASAPLGRTTSFYLGSARGWIAGLPTWGQVTFADVWPGIAVTWGGDGRRLVATYTLDPGADASAIAFSLGDAVHLNDDGSATVGLGGKGGEAPARVLRLEAPRASQGGKTLEAAWVLGESGLGVAVESSGRETVEVEARLTVGGPVRQYRVAEAEAGPVVVGSSAATVRAGAVATAGDAFVAQIDRTSNTVSRVVYLGGSGDDAAHGVAVDGAGNLLVIGATASPDFPSLRAIQPPGGDRDAFLVRLSPYGELISSTPLGGVGDDEGHDVTVLEDGSVAVVGLTAGDLDTVAPDTLEFTTVVPVPRGPAESAGHFVSVVDNALATVEASVTVEMQRVRAPISVWVDPCSGLTVGTNGTTSSCALSNLPTFDSYTISEPTGYNASLMEWGDLAMQWKDKVKPEVYNPGAVGTFPGVGVRIGDESILNTIEATAFTPGDPGGGWGVNFAADIGELGVGASMYHDWWDSPVFVDDINGESMIIATYWRLNTGIPSLKSFCNSVGWDSTKDDPIDVVDNDCADLGDLYNGPNPVATLCWVRANMIDHVSVSFPYIEGVFVNGVNFDWAFRNTEPYLGNVPGHAAGINPYIGDPPDGEEHMAGYAAEMGARLSSHVLAPAEVEQVRWVGETAVSRATYTADVPVGTLP